MNSFADPQNRNAHACMNAKRVEVVDSSLAGHLPAMEPFGVVADADGSVEKLAEAGFGEQFFARTVADDAAVAHKNDAVDFRQYVAEMMGDHNETGAFAGEATEGFAKLALGGEIEGSSSRSWRGR